MADAQEEQPSSRECHLKKEGLWQSEEHPVGYLGGPDPDEMNI